MERKNYLIEKLSNEEKLYLKRLVTNERERYLKVNYKHFNNIELEACINTEADSILEVVINQCEEAIESAVEFEKIISNEKLYSIVKELPLKEKMLLFSLYKENKTINQIALEMGVERTTVWRSKNNVLNKLMQSLLGGNLDV